LFNSFFDTRLKSSLRWFASLLLGSAGAFAFTPLGGVNGVLLSLAVWAGLFWLLYRQGKTTTQGALIAAMFGLGFFGSGVSWVYISLHDFGGMSPALAGLATFLFCGLLASFHALFGFLFVLLRNCLQGEVAQSALPIALLFGTLWGLLDWVRGWIFSGFPWLSLGYSQISADPTLSPLAGYFPLLGVFGVSLLTALSAALLVSFRRGWGFLLLLWVGGFGLGQISWTQAVGDSVAVALVQGNIPQSVKWNPETYAHTLATNARLVTEALNHRSKPTVVILPETAFPSFVEDIPSDYLAALDAMAKAHAATLLVGVVTGDGRQYHNSGITVGQAPGQVYHKSHLVPFGESIPPGFAWFLSLANIPMSAFTPAELPQEPMRLGGALAAVNICYEDIFGEEIIRGLPAANFLINLSNTAWFGDSLAQPQHLQIARARALETGRSMLRATNTGMTALIRQDGYVVNVLPAFTEGILFGEVQGYSGTTPYARWGNGAFLLLSISFLLNVLRRKQSVST
jgi:apolipoprotein N-acyltransferase